MLTAAALTALALALAACGGDGDSGTGGATTTVEGKASTLAEPQIARAEANCRRLLRETRGIGRSLPRGTVPTNLEMTTNLLVAPSVPVLEGVADRMRPLETETDNAEFKLYAGLFDPIVVLSKLLLTAGEANDSTSAKGFEAMLTELGDEQRRIAARLGLRACQVDFQHVLVTSITE